jgi:hypothetical protein
VINLRQKLSSYALASLSKEKAMNRIGTEALRIIEAEKRRRLEAPLASTRPGETWSVSRKIRSWTKASRIRDKLLQIVLGSKDWKALGVGRFRLGGEIHQWMYDRFSLRRLIEQAGFRGVIQRSATESYIENWASENLDTNPDGSVYKPDSLFMEAVKTVK